MRKNFLTSKSSPKKKGSRRGLIEETRCFRNTFDRARNYERYEVEYPMCVPGEIFRAIGHDNRREDVNPFIICISGEQV